MSELSDLVAADFAEIQPDNACTFTWNGVDYDGVRGIISRNNQQRDPGFLVNNDLRVFVAVSEFDALTAYPALGNKFTIATIEYRVIQIDPDPTGGVIVYTLQDPKM